MNTCFGGRQPALKKTMGRPEFSLPLEGENPRSGFLGWAHYSHSQTATWLPPHRHCGNGCVEVERETDTANRLRALVARMVELLPNEHPLAAEARQLLE